MMYLIGTEERRNAFKEGNNIPHFEFEEQEDTDVVRMYNQGDELATLIVNLDGEPLYTVQVFGAEGGIDSEDDYADYESALEAYESAQRAETMYTVISGWIERVQVGGRIEERCSDSPSSQEFGTYEEAKAAFDATDIERQWRTEKMCAGKAWDGRAAYKAIEVYEVDADDCPEYVGTTDHETYDGEGADA